MKYKLLLLGVFLIALALRLYRLNDFRCLNWDEAAFGYNAYSVEKTGRDEYGVKYPLQFKSVGDYKAPLYIYLMVPVIRYLSLNEFSVRLLPSFFGSLTVISLYFIVYLLFKRKDLATLSAFLLAISPWHLQFTRAGADVGVGTFFVSIGILGFLAGTNRNKYGFVISFLGFVAAIYTYFGERLFVPLFFIFLLILYRTVLITKKREFLKSALIGLLIIVPILPSLLSSGHKEKIFKTTIFGYERSPEYIDLIKKEDSSTVTYSLFHTGLLENTWGVLNRYFNHFSPSFLFLEGVEKDPRQFIYGMGMMYLIELPFLILGLLYIVRLHNKKGYFLLGWLLIAPIPAAITRDLESARRSINMVYPLVILVSIGILEAYGYWKRLKFNQKLLFGICFLGIYSYFITFYFGSYYIFTKNRAYKGPAGWQCGYKELVTYVNSIKFNYDEIIIDTTYQGPYIFFLFYEKYDPALYQSQAHLIQKSESELGEGKGYDNYTFRPIYWPNDRCFEKKLFIGPPERLPDKDIKEGEASKIHTVNFFNGEPAFTLVETIRKDLDHCKNL